MINDIKRGGYSVSDLYNQLKIAIDSGYGKRAVMIGPIVNPEGAIRSPITAGQRVYGVEANDEYEQGIFWLYPDEPEV